jgi:hypothetical protein
MSQAEVSKLLTTINSSYSKAPYFTNVMPIVESILADIPVYIHELAHKSVVEFCKYLDIQTVLKSSLRTYGNEELKKADRLIDICLKEKKYDYINAAGGMEIYTKEYFKNYGVNISFIKSRPIEYKQFNESFVPWLSIIDVAMFNSVERIKDFLNSYDLI